MRGEDGWGSLVSAATGTSTSYGTRNHRLPAAALAAFAVLASAAFPPSARTASTDFGIDSTETLVSSAQAGRFADVETRFRISGNPVIQEGGQNVPWASLRDLAIELPPGLVGNLNEFPTCTGDVFVEQLDVLNNTNVRRCPGDSQVGVISPGLTGLFAFPPGAYKSPLFNLERPTGKQQVVARLGAVAFLSPIFIDIRLDPKRDNALTGSIVNAPSIAGLAGANTTIWGVPAHPSHDDERFDFLEAMICGKSCSGPVESGLEPIGLMSNPTSCGASDLGLWALSYADLEGGDYGLSSISFEGCERVPFEPSLSVSPTTPRAGAPSGVDVSVHLPQQAFLNPSAPRTADLRRAVVTLPKGVAVNASVVDGLASCTEQEVGFDPDERQLVNFDASGAPVTLSLEGETTPELPHLASAQAVQAALEGLPAITAGDLVVSGRRGGPWQVDFGGSLGGQDVPPITGVQSEVQRLAIKATEGGVYSVAFDGHATPALPFDADAATVQAALEDLPGIDPGDLAVIGGPTTNGSVFRLVFGGDLAQTDVPQTTTTSSLIGLGTFAKTFLLAQGGSPAGVRTMAQGGTVRFDGASARCPDASKVASGEVETPLLTNPLRASVYLADPNRNPLRAEFGAYLVAEGEGALFKVPGQLEVDPESGRVVMTLDDMPQLPISDLRLRFKSGDRAVVTTPTECGTYRGDWQLTPWSRSAPESGTSKFTIDQGCGEDAVPIRFSAGSSRAVGGSFTTFATRIERGGRASSLSGVSVDFPLGLTAKLAGVGRCPEGTIDALQGSSAGRPYCPGGSRVGTVTAGVGSGSPFYADPGDVFLAGPYKGAPISLLAVAPAIAGPFDLGQVAVRVALHIDPDTAQVHAVSDPLPDSLHGIPLEFRDIRVELDRAGFALNPTSCVEKSVTGTIDQVGGHRSRVAERFQIGECAALRFEPTARVRLSGAPGRNGHPAIAIELEPRVVDANLAAATVALPAGELVDIRRVQALCADDLTPEGCPRSSRLGAARLWSPLLDDPLTGPVHLRPREGRLPDIVADLRSGMFHVRLRARTTGRAGRLVVRFPALPDLPISRALFRLPGGSRGIVVNSEALCARTRRAQFSFAAHNGRVYQTRPPVHVLGRC